MSISRTDACRYKQIFSVVVAVELHGFIVVVVGGSVCEAVFDFAGAQFAALGDAGAYGGGKAAGGGCVEGGGRRSGLGTKPGGLDFDFGLDMGSGGYVVRIRKDAHGWKARPGAERNGRGRA